MILFYFLKKLYKLKFITYKYLIKPKKAIKSIYGIYLTPAFSDVTFKYYLKGTYGLFLSNLISNIDRDTIFVDIGANQGLYSVLAGKNKNIKQVVSFEPSAKTAKLLRSNIKLNKVNNCTVIEKGISDKAGVLHLNISEGHSGKNTFRQLKNNDDSSQSETVEIISHKEIDKLIPDHRRHFVKIDVEGHEEIVINELVKCSFFKNVMQIFCEIDAEWVDVNAIKETLSVNGFSNFEKIGNNKTHYDLLISRTS